MALKLDFKHKWLYTFLFLTNNNFYVWFIWLLQVHNFQKIKWNNPWVFYFISSLTPPLIKLFKHARYMRIFLFFSLFFDIKFFFYDFNFFFLKRYATAFVDVSQLNEWMREWAIAVQSMMSNTFQFTCYSIYWKMAWIKVGGVMTKIIFTKNSRNVKEDVNDSWWATFFNAKLQWKFANKALKWWNSLWWLF